MSRFRLGLLIPWALFVAFCIGWTAYWFTAKDTAIKALDAGIARAKVYGADAGYGRVRAGGYPLHLTLTLTDAHLSLARVRIDAAQLPVSVNLSNPRHIIVGLADGLRWEREDRVVHRLATKRGEMSARLAADGALARLSLDMEGARVTHGMSEEATTIGKLLVHLRPDPRHEADAQLVVDAGDWAGPTPFAALNAAGPFSVFRAALVLTDYATLASQTPAQTWTGALRIERVDVTYAGAKVSGDGLLDLDDQYRVTGDLKLTPEGGTPVTLAAADGWWTFAGLRVAPAKPLYTPSPPD